MDVQSTAKPQNQSIRSLASLKILSRLLGHELHLQGGSKTIQLSREEAMEIQATIDLFIEDITRRQGTQQSTPLAPALEPQLVSSRN